MLKKEVNNQRYILILGTIVFCSLFFYALRSVLLPFVVGIVVAYFLDPLVSRMAKKGISRATATTIVIGAFLIIFLPLCVLLGSAVFSQVADFAAKLPVYASSFAKRIMMVMQQLQEHFAFMSYDNIETMLQENTANSVRLLGKILKGVISNGFAFINLLSLLLISPVVAFYMLRDWPDFTGKLLDLIPRKHKNTVTDGIAEVNKIISGYLRGQFLVCVILGSYYSVSLFCVGLELGVMVGFLAGLISFIPYVGSISGFLMAIALAVTQYGTWGKIIAVVVVFGIGQLLEGNFLTPKLVGENIGLHPVWVMFALLAGGVLLGLLGMIIAVPVAAIVGVFLRYLIKNYKQSPLYLDK